MNHVAKRSPFRTSTYTHPTIARALQTPSDARCGATDEHGRGVVAGTPRRLPCSKKAERLVVERGLRREATENAGREEEPRVGPRRDDSIATLCTKPMRKQPTTFDDERAERKLRRDETRRGDRGRVARHASSSTAQKDVKNAIQATSSSAGSCAPSHQANCLNLSPRGATNWYSEA